MSEQYRCKSCGYVFDMKDMMCSECGIGRFELLRWTKGGDGSHWEGCADVHWDCKIAQLEAEIEKRDETTRYMKSIIAGLEQSVSELSIEIHDANSWIARLQEERRWRKYPDEEPENLDEEVQLWSKVYGLTKASFNSWNDYVGYSDITHWMPLPASPESEEK